MKKIDQVFGMLKQMEKGSKNGVSAEELSTALNIDRTSTSRYLNKLFQENLVEKTDGRPVLYKTIKGNSEDNVLKNIEGDNSFDRIVEIYPSLQLSIQQAKAAILYPPRGLHTLILGETGVGKSMFAELMHSFAIESGAIAKSAPFIHFNCADYAENPQLVIAQIFGVKKGAYTGADKDKEGLLKKADGGMLFLDEVHRLSSQGQEMLFTFIDQGKFSPLGETEKTAFAKVQIIAATTEDPRSYLLNTFARRIPMIVKLPALRERGAGERYKLIETFIQQESKRIGKNVYINKNSIISLLLYECPNNIGQLKSDIQLACAKAFVNYKSRNESYILVAQTDLPQHVRRGIMNINKSREEIDYLLKSKEEVLRFSHKEQWGDPMEQSLDNGDFYDTIEKRIGVLKNAGIKDEEINQIINIDIEGNFKKYIGQLPQKLRNNEINKIINQEAMDISCEILDFSSERLKRKYDEKIKIGFALHISGFIDRIQKGMKIYHPRLNLIRIEHHDEFLTAMEAVKLIDIKLGIHTPLDEIGYITMFLASPSSSVEEADKDKVGILVMMHGNSTASSMVEVCNSLIGTDHAAALDMPLDMEPQEMYKLAKAKAVELNKGRGILLLVDMGSLTNFGDMIYEETGIMIKTIDLTSTPIVLDACRKAVLGRELYYIYDSIIDSFKTAILENKEKMKQKDFDKKNIIITACYTGEGASEKLKHIIKQELDCENIEIIPLNIMDTKEFSIKVEQYKEKYQVLAVVSTVSISLGTTPFICAIDILSGEGISKLNAIISNEQVYGVVRQSLREHIEALESETLIEKVREVIENIEEDLKLKIKNEVKIGMVLHLCFTADKLKQGDRPRSFEDLQSYKNQFHHQFTIVKNRLQNMEKTFGLKIGDDEAAYICKMFLSNSEFDISLPCK